MVETKAQMCRGCLSTLDNSNCNSLFDSRLLGQIFQETTFIIVASNDGLPSVLCNTCTQSLRESFKFKTMCISSDFELKRRVWTDRLFYQRKQHLNGFSFAPQNRRRSNSFRYDATTSDSDLSESDASSGETATQSNDQNLNQNRSKNVINSKASTPSSVKVRLKRLSSTEINELNRTELRSKVQIKNNGCNVNIGANKRNRKRDSGRAGRKEKRNTINISSDWERERSRGKAEESLNMTNDNQMQSTM